MKNIITRKSWDSVSEITKKLNSEFYKLTAPIADGLKTSDKDYVYELEVPFGELLIQDGKCVFVNEEKPKEFTFNDEINASYNWVNFYDDCKNTSDFPLSLVTNDKIEIYSQNKSISKSNINNGYSYTFPISVINEGDILGTWGSIDKVSALTIKNTIGWHGVAGRISFLTVCKDISSLPKNQKNFWYSNYMFEINETWEDNFLEYFKKKSQSNNEYIVKILIFPEFYYTLDEYDSSHLKYTKLAFQNYLLKNAWVSVERYRNIFWHIKDINQKCHNSKNNLYDSFFVHNLNLTHENEAYSLRVINESDGVIYKMYNDFILDLNSKKTIDDNWFFPGILIFGKAKDYAIISIDRPTFIAIFDDKTNEQLGKVIEGLFLESRIEGIEIYKQSKVQNNFKDPECLQGFIKEQLKSLLFEVLSSKTNIKIELPYSLIFSLRIPIKNNAYISEITYT
ncbi:MAG: hypothetical protein PHV20_09320 [Bacteroidales bacterium]|nr:hypothetical protein [Bacteroidales bacterium]